MAEEFIEKLSHLRDLSAEEDAVLRGVFSRTKRVQKGAALFSEGKLQDTFFVVKSGWFYSYTILNDGSRQVHDTFTAGDVIGMENLSLVKAPASVACIVSGEVYMASLSHMHNLLRDHRALDQLLRSVQMVKSVKLVDRLTAIARLDAYNRLAYFLSDIFARQKLGADVEPNILYMPLSQTFIADCLGLSSVHVSRQFTKLTEAGLIEKIGNKRIRILDFETLQIEGDYKNRFENLLHI